MKPAQQQALADSRCWQAIGIQGDRSCAELAQRVHCRNCPVYWLAGRRLLERPPPEDYQAEWLARLAEPAPLPDADTLALMLFRVADAWLALPAACCDDSLSPVPVRKIPHRTRGDFLGLINVRGELQLCFTLEHLLELKRQTKPAAARRAFPRILLIKVHGQRWAFPVDEVQGISRHPRSCLLAPPAHVRQAAASLTVGLLAWDSHAVAVLDAERLAKRFAEALH